nr:hypothetical protein [uncultured Ruminococcus sp.]
MNENTNTWEKLYDSEELSREMERDARRYNKAFTEEEEVRLI